MGIHIFLKKKIRTKFEEWHCLILRLAEYNSQHATVMIEAYMHRAVKENGESNDRIRHSLRNDWWKLCGGFVVFFNTR